MSKTLTGFNVSFTVHSSEHLPEKNGEQMYADDVTDEIRTVVQGAVAQWYEQRGKELLACEPDVG
ncbi:hypothetical protein PV755_45315 [Streptomyces caniscabiei]|uniref:hypothetical protein n=1 Tax=Streptomyces caniscabiei TaxID=2746961 RepID=UPI0029AC1EDF|nr:hypothetical protein [Streptomyces caniscabiei]MDX3516036.1 hypothetical protein [Streptomyces caniscabiei]